MVEDQRLKGNVMKVLDEGEAHALSKKESKKESYVDRVKRKMADHAEEDLEVEKDRLKAKRMKKKRQQRERDGEPAEEKGV